MESISYQLILQMNEYGITLNFGARGTAAAFAFCLTQTPILRLQSKFLNAFPLRIEYISRYLRDLSDCPQSGIFSGTNYDSQSAMLWARI